MQADRYRVFTSGQCPWCVKVINVLGNLHLDMDVISLKNNMDAIKFLQENNLKTVPQVYLGDEHIGGYEDTIVHLSEKGLLPNTEQ